MAGKSSKGRKRRAVVVVRRRVKKSAAGSASSKGRRKRVVKKSAPKARVVKRRKSPRVSGRAAAPEWLKTAGKVALGVGALGAGALAARAAHTKYEEKHGNHDREQDSGWSLEDAENFVMDHMDGVSTGWGILSPKDVSENLNKIKYLRERRKMPPWEYWDTYHRQLRNQVGYASGSYFGNNSQAEGGASAWSWLRDKAREIIEDDKWKAARDAARVIAGAGLLGGTAYLGYRHRDPLQKYALGARDGVVDRYGQFKRAAGGRLEDARRRFSDKLLSFSGSVLGGL
jgi:hypothetical protein